MKQRTFLTGACVAMIGLSILLAGCGGGGRRQAPPGKKWTDPPTPPPAVPAYVPRAIDPALVTAAKQEIVTAAKSNDAVIRAHAIESVQRAMPKEGEPILLDGLTDKASIVRFSAAMAVGELRIAAAKPRLLEMVEDTSRNVQVAVRFALHRLGDTTYSHDLEKTSRDPERSVRANTAVALGLLGEPSAMNILRPMQGDRDATIRLQVAEAMWRLGSKDGLDSLVGATVSAYPDDQMIAMMALAGPRRVVVIQSVRGGLTSDYVEVTLVSARAMGLLGSHEGYGVALQSTGSVDPRQRSLAALAFGAIGRSDAQDILAQLLKDSDADVRLSAATAMLQLKE